MKIIIDRDNPDHFVAFEADADNDPKAILEVPDAFWAAYQEHLREIARWDELLAIIQRRAK